MNDQHNHESNHCGHQEKVKSKSFVSLYWRPIVSFVMLIIGLVATHSNIGLPNYAELIWFILAYLPVGLPVLKEAIEAASHKDFFSEFTLMSIATIGAFAIKQYPEGVAVMLFYTVGEYFQEKAIVRAKKNIGELLDKRPEKVTVIRNNESQIISPKEVVVGETIELKAGERIPLDGTMLSEHASFDTAALTGESVPRNIFKGGKVLAGMIVLDKVIRLKIDKPYEESTLSRILKLVQEASSRKAPAELFMRKFARIYTPVAIGLSILIIVLPFIYSLFATGFAFDISTWLYRALVFLVISCPCALVISIPLGYFGGIGAASKYGILFKGGNYLDAITKIDAVAFDKTGTITKGIFEVSELSTEMDSEDKFLSLISSIESKSNHPISKAILKYAQQKNIDTRGLSQVNEIAGFGLTATYEGSELIVGNLRLLDNKNIIYPETLKKKVGTLIVASLQDKYIGYILLEDQIKEDSKLAVDLLKGQGIKHIVMLSGDKKEIVDKIATQTGIDEAYGELLPLDKVKHIEKFRHQKGYDIAFVGDGMNDAPVLAISNIGIAMGGLGSDAAIETADVVIQNDHPSMIAKAIHIGKVTKTIVWQNIIMAIGVKTAILLLGIFGLTSLWAAVFADVGVALLAILNSIRILKYFK